MAILEVGNISKRSLATQAPQNVGLAFHPGQVHAIVGENGAGKSTLMNLIGGVHLPDTGEIFLKQAKPALKSPHDALLLGIGFVYQEISLCRHLSVAENIFMTTVDKTNRPVLHFNDLNRRDEPRRVRGSRLSIPATHRGNRSVRRTRSDRGVRWGLSQRVLDAAQG